MWPKGPMSEERKGKIRQGNLGCHHKDRWELPYREIYDLYTTQKLSVYDIARLKGTGRSWIYDRLREYGIPRTYQHPTSLERHRQKVLGRPSSSKTKIKKGEHRSPQTEFQKGHRPSIKAIEASHRAQNKRPNKIEGKLLSIIEKAFPKEYRYTGDGSFLIQGVCPDFVNCNGQKKVIEIFGDYWHSDKKVRNWKETELGRFMLYNGFGFDCLILWERDILAKSEEELIAILHRFTKQRKQRSHLR